MSISKTRSKKGTSEPRKEKPLTRRKYPQGMIMTRKELESLIARVPIGDAKAAAGHLVAISRAAVAIQEGGSRDENLLIIRLLALEVRNRSLRKLLRGITEAAEYGGKRGLNAAIETALMAYYLAFEYLPNWDSGERLYERMLKQALHRKS